MSTSNIKRKLTQLLGAVFPRDLLNRSSIEKTLFLAHMSVITPVIYALAITYGYLRQIPGPGKIILDPSFTALFLSICVAHILILSFVIVQGNTLRKNQGHSGALWYVVAFSWVVSNLTTTFLVGTYYSDGMLMLLLGFMINLPLNRHQALFVSFGFALVLFIILTAIDLSGLFPAGALFSTIPYENGQPWGPWLFVRLTLCIGAFGLAFIAGQTVASWQAREQKFRRLSNTDGLTLLSNRSYFLHRSALVFQQVNRRTDALACILLDLDHFKKINDTYGHHAGDKVLIAVAQVLKQNAREYDEVSRLGGEEFAILMPTTTIDVAAQVATRIRKRLEAKTIEVDGRIIKVTTSIGVACYPDTDINGIEDLLKKADLALYEAKRCGRNKVIVAGENDFELFKTA